MSLSDLDKELSQVIHSISELSEEDLGLLFKMIERTYIHTLIEHELRLSKLTSVSRTIHHTGNK